MVEEMPRFTSKARQQAYESLLKQRQGRTITKAVYDKKKAQIIAREQKSVAYFEEKKERRAAEGAAKRAATMAAKRAEKEKMKFNMTPTHDGESGFKKYMLGQIWDKRFTYPVSQDPINNSETPEKMADRIAHQILAKIPVSKNRYIVRVRFESPPENGISHSIQIVAYNGVYDREAMLKTIKNAIYREVTKYIAGQGDVTEQHYVEPTGFDIISIKQGWAGSCGDDVEAIKFDALVLSSPKSKNNNCLIACIHKSLGIKSNQVKPDMVRQKLGIKLNTPIHINDIPKFASEYKCRIVVVNPLNEVLVESGEGQEIKICLYVEKSGQGHYALVKSVAGKCRKCGISYKYSHTEESCQSVLKHKVLAKQTTDKMVVKAKFKVGQPDMLFVDFETFVNESRVSEIYAAGWWVDDQYQQVYGEGAADKFMADLLKQKNKVVCAYNGSGFDFHFIVSWLLDHGHKVTDMVVVNGAILSAKFGENMRMWDINRFTMSSLKNACDAFNVPAEVAKTEFNHLLIKSWVDVETYRAEVEPYLKNDVLSLKAVYDNFRDFIYDIFKCEITQFLTAPAMAYGIWTNTVEKVYIEVPDASKYKFIRESVYGGRTYPMSKEFKSSEFDKVMAATKEERAEMYKSLTDWIFNGDITSLYPTAMEGYQYGVGKGEWVSGEVVETWDVLKPGIYEVDVKSPKNIIVPVLPDHKKGGISWNLSDKQNAIYTHIDLENAMKHGYEVVKFHRALVYDAESPVFKEYITKAYKIKSDGDAEKNEVKRSIGKLLMNALYGKMLERARFTKTQLCNDIREVWKFMSEHKLTDITFMGDKVLLTGEPHNEEGFDKAIKKPAHLGAMVLGNSRRVMLDVMAAMCPGLDKHFFTYTDTDSLHIHCTQLEGLKAKGWLEKGLGKLSDD